MIDRLETRTSETPGCRPSVLGVPSRPVGRPLLSDELRDRLHPLAVALGCALLGLASWSCSVGPSLEPADLVLLNGKIVTVEDSQPQVEALAARNGVVVALGDNALIEPYIGPSTQVLDLEGRFAMPGFVEGHGHFMGLGDSMIQLDLRHVASWEEIVEIVAQAAAKAEPGQWIRGRGWHQDKWSHTPEPAVEGFPVHGSLSAVSPDNPVLLTHASGHAAFVNAKALEIASIDASTADPPGGEILKGRDGRPTGLLRETAQGLAQRARSADGTPPADEALKMVELASQECVAKGITSFQDAGSSFATIGLLRRAADEGILGVRLWVMVRDSNEAIAEKMEETRVKGYAHGMLSVGGIKLSVDGALGSRGAWLLEPYTDSPGSFGLNLVPLDVARETAELAVEHGVQLCIHAIGDRANREVLDLYGQVFADHPEAHDLRWRIEHAQHLHPDDIARFAQLGVIASMQGVHCTSDGPWVPDRLGDERSEQGAYVWRKLMDSGAMISNGTDTPVEDVSPIQSYYSTVSRMMNNGERFYPDQRLSRTEALKTYTWNAAYAAFEEDRKGSLAAGKLADITVLSQDLLEVAEEEIPATEVLYTIIGGKVVYARPDPLTPSPRG